MSAIFTSFLFKLWCRLPMFMIILCISQQTSTSGRSHTRSQVGGQRLLLLGGTFWFFMVLNATFNNISVIMAVGGFWSFFFNNWHIFFVNPGRYFLPINIEYRRNKNQNISSLKAVIAINVCCFCNIAISDYVERSMVANEATISN